MAGLPLFTPLALGQFTVANHVVVSPMCEYSTRDGNATGWHMQHLGSLAVSNAGLLMTEATAAEPEGRIAPADLELYNCDSEAALRRVVRACRSFGNTLLGIQIGHAGRKGSAHVPWEGGAAQAR